MIAPTALNKILEAIAEHSASAARPAPASGVSLSDSAGSSNRVYIGSEHIEPRYASALVQALRSSGWQVTDDPAQAAASLRAEEFRPDFAFKTLFQNRVQGNRILKWTTFVTRSWWGHPWRTILYKSCGDPKHWSFG